MPARHWVQRAVAIAGACLLLSGCFSGTERVEEITEENVVGEWRATIDGHTIDLQIEADGTLAFQNIPRQALNTYGDELFWEYAIESTTGTWEITDDDMCCGDPWFRIHVEDRPEVPSSVLSTQLFVHGVEPNIELWRYWNGESDPPIRFERVGDDD